MNEYTEVAVLIESVLGAGTPAVTRECKARLESGEIVIAYNITDPGLKAGTHVNLMQCKRGNTEEMGNWVIVAAETD